MPAARATKKSKDAPSPIRKRRERSPRPLDHLLTKNKGKNLALLRPTDAPEVAAGTGPQSLQEVYAADALLRQSVRLEAQARLADSSVEAYNYWAKEFIKWSSKAYAAHPAPTCVDESKLLSFLAREAGRNKKKRKPAAKGKGKRAARAEQGVVFSDDDSEDSADEDDSDDDAEDEEAEAGSRVVAEPAPLVAVAAGPTADSDAMDVDQPHPQPAGTGPQKLSLSSLEKCAAGVVNLWKMQKAQGWNNNPNPRGNDVKDFLSNLRGRKADWDHETFAPRLNPLNKGYPVATLLKLCEDLLNQPALTGLRAHTGQLLSHACFFRGEAVRRLELVDLAVGEIGAEEEGNVARFLAFRLTKGKTNKHGKLKMTACLRHRDPLRCPVFAVALYLFWRFHCFEEPFPDLSQPERWYRTKVLKAEKTGEELSYKDHAKYIKAAFVRNGLEGAPHTTHAPRAAGAMEAEAKGVQQNEIARLGHWVTAGSSNAMVEAYLHLVPQSTMRALSGFRKEGEDYFLPRAAFEPPPELLGQVFPEVDKWLKLLNPPDEPEAEGGQTGEQQGQKKAKKKPIKTGKKGDKGDGGVRNFLNVLVWLRKVFLQDIYRLKKISPGHPVLRHEIFRKPAFHQWAQEHKERRESVMPPLHSTLRQVAPPLFDEVSALRSGTMAVVGQVDVKVDRLDVKVDRVEGKVDGGLNAVTAALQSLQVSNATLLRGLKYRATRGLEGHAELVHAIKAMAVANESTAVSHSRVMGIISNNVDTTRQVLACLDREEEAAQAGPSGSAPSPTRLSPANDEAMVVDEREKEAEVIPDQYPLLDLWNVSQAWREYDEGLDGLLSLKEREKRFGYTWCGEKSNCAKRKQFKRRMFLNREIERCPAGPEREQQIERLQKRCDEEFKGSVRSLAEWFEKKHAADNKALKAQRSRL